MLKYKEQWEQFFPEFIQSGEASMQSLMESAVLVHMPSGQHVFMAGTPCENYLLLIKGSVKTQLLSENGREVLLYQVKAGHSCVLTTSCLLSGEQYPAEGITEGEVSAFVISSHAFYRCMEKSAFFREFVFKNFAERLSSVIMRLGDVVFTGIEYRLAKELLHANAAVIHITHQELAIKLGSVREVVSRQIKQFETKGWVELTRGTIKILDFQALEQLVNPNSK